jgi:hypothetical protein
MLVTDSRPRNLRWIHAGPLLYGDWGTSRLYVLGLAFLYTAHASVIYLAAIGVLMLAVSWAYTIVCRCFPDGGGVYSAAARCKAWKMPGGFVFRTAEEAAFAAKRLDEMKGSNE